MSLEGNRGIDYILRDYILRVLLSAKENSAASDIYLL